MKDSAVIEQTRKWAERTGLRHEFRCQAGVLRVWLPSDGAEAKLAAFASDPDTSHVLLTLGDLESGWGMILQIQHNGRITRLFEILDAAPRPVTLAGLPRLRDAVISEFPDTTDETVD